MGSASLLSRRASQRAPAHAPGTNNQEPGTRNQEAWHVCLSARLSACPSACPSVCASARGRACNYALRLRCPVIFMLVVM